MYEKIKNRYEKGYVTNSQLMRYISLGVLTEKHAEKIKALENE